MIAVTTQSCAQERLRQVAATLGMPAPTFYPRVSALPGGNVPDTVLLLDMGSCCREPRLQLEVRAWLSRHPKTALIAFVPLLDRDAEMHAVFELASIAGTQVMTASDFGRIEVWHHIVAQQTIAMYQDEISRDFREAVARTGRELAADSIVIRLLQETPLITDVHVAAAEIISQASTHAGSLRIAVWRELHNAGQLSATRLLVVFQLLWCRRLAELGWSSATVAAFLGFRSPRELRLTLKRRFGVSIEQIRAISYRDALEWSAELCTRPHGAGETPLKAMIEPLVGSDRVVVRVVGEGRRRGAAALARAGAHIR